MTEPLYQINVKTPKGSLLNIRASSEAELDQALDGLTVRIASIADLESTIDAICAVSNSGLKPEVVNHSAVAAVAPSYPAPAGYKPAGAAAPTCTGGACGGVPMRLVPAGIAKATGRPYKGFYACPLPQGQACKNKVPA
jgi:hypothetical protein